MAKKIMDFVRWSQNATPTQIIGTLLTLIPVIILSLETWAGFLRHLQSILLGLVGGQPVPPPIQ